MADDVEELDGGLVEMAMQLGISTEEIEGYSSNDALNRAIQSKTKQIATAAARTVNPDGEDEDERRGAFDETMGNTRGVLVRVVEWTEWIPAVVSEHFKPLLMQNGLTGFEAGENEKVVDISVSRTGQVKSVTDEDVPEGEPRETFYALYAFQAVLAQNVNTDLISDFIDMQGGNDEGKIVKGQGAPGERLITAESIPKGPNRAARRHPR